MRSTPGAPAERAPRLKNVRFVAAWGGGSGRRVAAVTLAEAESLRWLLHRGAPLLRGLAGLGMFALWDVAAGVCHGGEGPPPTAVRSELFRTVLLVCFICTAVHQRFRVWF